MGVRTGTAARAHRRLPPVTGPYALTVSAEAGADCRTVAAAVRAAADGAVITVRPGLYPENLVLTKPVTITSSDGAASAVIAPPNGRVLTMATGAAEVRGLILRATDDGCAGVDVPSGTLRLHGCHITGSASAAVLVRDLGAAVLTGCTIDNAFGAGLIVTARSDTSMSGCEIERCATSGVVATGDATPTIRQCAIRSCSGNGVYASGHSQPRIADCDISQTHKPAIALAEHSSASVARTVIRGPVGVGIYLATDGAATVEDCSIRDAGDAILVAAGCAPIVRQCRIERSVGHGISVTATSAGTFDDCEISAAQDDAVAISGESRPQFTRIRIADCKRHGVAIEERSAAELVGLHIADVAADGVHLTAGARAAVRQALVRRSGGYGVAVAEDASCELSDSDLSETGAAAVRVTGSGRLTVARTALQRAGVSIDTDGALTLADCSISAVAGSGVNARDTARLDLLRTKVEDCTAAGIALEGGVQARLRECEIRSNGTDGIVVATTGAVHISDTAVVDNAGWGIARRQPAGELVTDAVASRGNGAEHGDGAVAAPRMPLGGAPRDPADEMRAELARLVGLDSVKSEVSDLADLIQISKQREAFGLPAPPISRHMVFSGPPGTGKTSVARLYGRLLAALGVLPRGHVVEVSRVDLVAQVVGGTAIKTTERFREALGGVFFIDEAYSLAAREAGLGPDFGREAIDALVKLMEDHRDQVVVIAAGYTVPMQAFVASNPGLASRISRTIEFPAYSVDELVTIVDGICEQHRYRIADEARVALAEHFVRARQQDNFGNARAARQIFESMVAAQARRLARRPGLHAQDLASLVAADVPAPAPMVQAAQVVPLRAPRKSGAAAEAVASR
jgi:hypothetical protein